MYLKFCDVCGEKFYAKSDKRNQCSKDCKRIAIEKKREELGQLCWQCKNACGGCSWSRKVNPMPVAGWDAEPTIVKDCDGDFPSYKIKKCPLFVKG